ncbi:MAG: hypothetical protein Q7Q73_07355 [Verrucomicrobiota bacterium JB024]|nr:hypothetical protein [Verrucomicrobiota bacterium JB024]
MNISKLPYYVKFVFLSGGDCYSTADINMLFHVKEAKSRQRMRSLDIGDRLIFEPQEDKVYRVTSISIRQIVEDTDDMNLGFDSEDAPAMQGADKECLFKVLVRMEIDN